MGVARCKGSRKGRCPTCSLRSGRVGHRESAAREVAAGARGDFVRWFSPPETSAPPKSGPWVWTPEQEHAANLARNIFLPAGSRVHSLHLHDAGGHSIPYACLYTPSVATRRKGRIRRDPYTGPPRGLAVATTRRPASARCRSANRPPLPPTPHLAGQRQAAPNPFGFSLRAPKRTGLGSRELPALSQPGDGDLSEAALKKAARPCGGRVRLRVRGSGPGSGSGSG